LNILIMPGFVSHVDAFWEHPSCRAFLVSLMALGRLDLSIVRGWLSDRVRIQPRVSKVTAEDIGTAAGGAHASRRPVWGVGMRAGMHQVCGR